MERTQFLFGKEIAKNSLEPEAIPSILLRAMEAKKKMREIPVSTIIGALERAGRKWADEEYPGRREALEKLPGLIGFSRGMVEKGLGYISEALKRENTERELELQLGSREYLDRFLYEKKYDGLLKAEPHGLLLHVSAGNVFVGAALNICNGLLTKNVNLIKLSSQDPLFPILFARSLVEEEPALAEGLALLHWKGGNAIIEDAFKSRVDAISVFGGEDAVESYRKALPPNTQLFRHGPKIGVALIGKEAKWDRELADRLVLDACMWDQNACSSPQLAYFEGKEEAVLEFIPLLAEAFRAKAKEIPIGDLSEDERVEISKAREMAKVEKARGLGQAFFDRGSIDWTVLFRSNPEFETSPLNRTLIVKAVSDFSELEDILRPYVYYLQSLGLELPHGRLEAFAGELASWGITRITEVGRMSAGKLGSPHDGGFPLREMIRWASLEREFAGYVDLDYLQSSDKEKILSAKLRDLVDYVADRSPFYRKFWGAARKFEELPVLDRPTLAENLPPRSQDALTGPLQGTYIFSTGGTMGKPRVFTFTPDELRDSTDVFGRGFRMAGIGKEDVVANLFMPGYLWSSFIVTNQALETIGCTILPIGATSERDKLADLLLDLGATCIVGIPTQIIAIAREFEERGVIPGIKKIGYAGEHLSQGSRDFLQRTLGAERIFSVGYAAVDVGPIAYACEHSEGTVHHVASDYCFVEILDPTTKKPVKEGEVGEIVVTNLKRRLTPIVRYAIGDLGRLLDENCPCGRTSRRFELLGRSDDVLIVGGSNYSTQMVESLVSQDSRFSQNYQMVATNPAHKDTLVFRLELSKTLPAPDREKLAEDLTLRARKNKDLSFDLDTGVLDFRVELLDPGKLPSVARTQKTKRTLDLRK
ncbi:MAG TPA: hypothetical protein DD435_12240 [Cyanobacteria bacterium UBA8530]|nr:hypothetical protein [Cyanobacteria bacterium UBA8530]